MTESVGRPALHAVMTFCTLASVEGETLCVSVPDAASLATLQSNSQMLERLLAHHAPGGPTRLRFVEVPQDAPGRAETGPSETPLERFQRLQAQNPFLSALVDTFGGELVL
jgi:hypothetical protein